VGKLSSFSEMLDRRKSSDRFGTRPFQAVEQLAVITDLTKTAFSETEFFEFENGVYL